MLCTRCGKRPAVVFVSNNNSKDAPTAGYCLTCAKELGIKPVEDLISKMGISDEDLENVQDQMNTLMNSMGDGDMSQLMEQLGADNLAEQMGDFVKDGDGSEDDDFSHGAPAFPAFFNSMFGGQNNNATNQDNNKKGKKEKKEKNRKHINLYCEDLTRKAREGKIDRIVGRDSEIESLLLTKKDMINKQLGDLNLQRNFGCTVTRIRRSGIDLSPSPDLALKFGDKLMVVGEREGLRGVARLLGNNAKQLSDTDFFPIAMGIVLGVLFGKINISFSDSVSFSPGLTGGVLMVALLLSAVGKTGPILWSMSGPANQLLRQLGLLLFLAEVGTSAGKNLVATFQESGLLLFGVGAAITVVPMLVAVVVGRLVFKISLLDLLGTITGGMTSTPGLAAADSMVDSNIPSVAYATVYPIAMVFLILFIQVIASAVY